MDATGGWLIITAALLTAGIWLAIWLRGRGGATPAAPARLILTNHAKQRMTERNVGRRQIELVIAAPTRVVPDAKNNSVRLERDIDGKTLRVWVAQPWPTSLEAVVKTTAWADTTISFSIPAAMTGLVVGHGGSTVRRLEVQNDARISVSRAGFVRVSSPRMASAESAKREILAIVGRTGRSGGLQAA